MQRHRFVAGASDQKVLLICCYIIASSTLVLTANPLSANPQWNTRNKIVVNNEYSFQLNGFKSDVSRMFGKVKNLMDANTNERYGSGSDTTRYIEHFNLKVIEGDGRCMFRSLVQGMAANNGVQLRSRDEKVEADKLKMEIKKVICDSVNEHDEFEDAIVAITIEHKSLQRYCKNIMNSNFWGGEAELSILSKLLSLPIIVYQPQRLTMFKVDKSAGFKAIATYSPELKNGLTREEPKEVVRLSFSSSSFRPNHYDLLLPHQESSSSKSTAQNYNTPSDHQEESSSAQNYNEKEE